MRTALLLAVTLSASTLLAAPVARGQVSQPFKGTVETWTKTTRFSASSGALLSQEITLGLQGANGGHDPLALFCRPAPSLLGVRTWAQCSDFAALVANPCGPDAHNAQGVSVQGDVVTVLDFWVCSNLSAGRCLAGTYHDEPAGGLVDSMEKKSPAQCK